MTKIYRVSGIDSVPGQKLFTLMDGDPAEISEGEMDLLIARDKMVTNRNIVRKRRGIGSEKSEKYNNSIDVLDDALHGLTTNDPVHYMAMIEEDILNGVYANHNEVTGIGCPDKIAAIRANRTARRRTERAVKMQSESVSGIGAKKKAAPAKTKTGNFLKKAATKAAPALKNVKAKTGGALKNAGGAIKKAAQKTGQVVAKAAKKVTKAAIKLNPVALVAKGVLEITLPKAAPFFLYLFINDPKIVAKLPAKVKHKRDKQIKIKNFIVNGLGMKESHFMGIVRNGIVKQMGASPETILAKKLQSITGIGEIGLAVATAVAAAKAAPFVIEIIRKIASAFKKSKPDGLEPSADDAPSDDDFGGLDAKTILTLASDIKQQNDTATADPEPSPLTREATANNTSSEESGNDAETTARLKKYREEQNELIQKEEQEKKEKDIKTAAYYKDSDGTEYRNGVKVVDTDDQGEIQKDAGETKEFATGGRKEWNSFGNKK